MFIFSAYGENGSYAVEENPDMNVAIGLLESGGPSPQSFVLNPNLVVHVKLIMCKLQIGRFASKVCDNFLHHNWLQNQANIFNAIQ